MDKNCLATIFCSRSLTFLRIQMPEIGSNLPSLSASGASSPQNHQDKDTDIETGGATDQPQTTPHSVTSAAEDDVDMQRVSDAPSSARTPTTTEPELRMLKEPVVTMHVVKFTETKLKEISQIKQAYDIAKKAEPRVDLRPKMSLLQQLPWSTPVVTSNGTLSEWLSTTHRINGGEVVNTVCFVVLS